MASYPPLPAPPTKSLPVGVCGMCGATVRWDAQGVLRCEGCGVACDLPRLLPAERPGPKADASGDARVRHARG